MADIKPKDIKDMSTEERIEMAARFAMESYCSLVDSNYLINLAAKDPKTFANLLTQMLKLQVELEKVRAVQNQSQATNNQPIINVQLVKPRDHE